MDKSFWNKLGRKPDNSQGHDSSVNPRTLSGTESYTLESNIHKSDSLTEQVDTGLDGNDYNYPTTQDFSFIVEADPGARRQDIANSHLSEGPRPGKIPYMFFNKRHLGKLGKDITGNPIGDTGLLLNITGNSAGGLGDAMFIPHTSIQRPAGMARGAYRTIDDGAMVPGVYVADPTRR
jgi:hypothetical protein